MNYHIWNKKDGIICHFEENSGRLAASLVMVLSP